MWVAHGYFAYVNEISFAYPEHEGVAFNQHLPMIFPIITGDQLIVLGHLYD